MSNTFKEFIQKVGSGNHTSQNLTRVEATTAMKMMLLGEAQPAQIGAFLIAHRIKRPTGEELAGMLDAYDEIGPKLQPINNNHDQIPIVLGIPYDGRIRTAPINIITALLLASSGKPVIMHGGDRYPTKYGLPLIEIWQKLGVYWDHLSLEKIQEIFNKTRLSFIYTPKHFPLTKSLWEYREQLGKRPPLATMELIWCPYAGEADIIAGFVHPPTESMLRNALEIQGVKRYTFVKGLEGSFDLPRDRTAIICISTTKEVDRLHIMAREYGFSPRNLSLGTVEELVKDMQSVLAGNDSELMETALWNGGFYLWRCGISPDISNGIETAKELFTSGLVAAKLQEVKSNW